MILSFGAGLAGLSAAYHLLGMPYNILDREREDGGLCRSYVKDGCTFDYTGHLLHFRQTAIKALVESLLLRRIYAAPELLQLAATFGVVLIVRDLTLATWGAEDLLGPRAAGFAGVVDLFGRATPTYELLLIVVGPLVLAGLWWLLVRTRFGVQISAFPVGISGA